MNGTRIFALSSAIAAATMLFVGCSPTEPSATPPSDAAPEFEHIHELVVDPADGALLVATHEGLYRLVLDRSGNATAVGPIGGLDFDPMGFTLADGTAYASGHPGPTTPNAFGSPNLGLITSVGTAEGFGDSFG